MNFLDRGSDMRPYQGVDLIYTLYILRTTQEYCFFSTDGTNLDTILVPKDYYACYYKKGEEIVKILYRGIADGGIVTPTLEFLDIDCPLTLDEHILLSAREQRNVERQAYGLLLEELADNFNLRHKFSCKGSQPCQSCPKCVLFGTEPSVFTENNSFYLPARIQYSSSISLEPLESVLTKGSVNVPRSLSTAHGNSTTKLIPPGTHFASVISLVNPTWYELKLIIQLLSTPLRYGRNKTTMGLVKNTIVAMSVGVKPLVSTFGLASELRLIKDFEIEYWQLLEEMEENLSYHGFLSDGVELIEGMNSQGTIEDALSYPVSRDSLEDLYKVSKRYLRSLRSFKR